MEHKGVTSVPPLALATLSSISVVSVPTTSNVTLASVLTMLVPLPVRVPIKKANLQMDVIVTVLVSVSLATATLLTCVLQTAVFHLPIKHGDLMLISVSVPLILNVPLLAATVLPTSVHLLVMVTMQWAPSLMVVSVPKDMSVPLACVQEDSASHSATMHQIHLLCMERDANALIVETAYRDIALTAYVVPPVWVHMPMEPSLTDVIASMAESVLLKIVPLPLAPLTVALLPSLALTASVVTISNALLATVIQVLLCVTLPVLSLKMVFTPMDVTAPITTNVSLTTVVLSLSVPLTVPC